MKFKRLYKYNGQESWGFTAMDSVEIRELCVKGKEEEHNEHRLNTPLSYELSERHVKKFRNKINYLRSKAKKLTFNNKK